MKSAVWARALETYMYKRVRHVFVWQTGEGHQPRHCTKSLNHPNKVYEIKVLVYALQVVYSNSAGPMYLIPAEFE